MYVREGECMCISLSMEKEMFRLVVLPCFDLCRSNSFRVCVCFRVSVCV